MMIRKNNRAQALRRKSREKRKTVLRRIFHIEFLIELISEISDKVFRLTSLDCDCKREWKGLHCIPAIKSSCFSVASASTTLNTREQRETEDFPKATSLQNECGDARICGCNLKPSEHPVCVNLI